MLKTNHIKYISVSLLISLMVGCQRPPLKSENNNVKVQANPSPVILQNADDFNSILSAHTELNKSIIQLNANLQKVIDGNLERKELDFTDSNKKIVQLKNALTKINNPDKIKNLADINKTISDIENAIKPLEKGFSDADVTQVQQIIKLQETQNIAPNGNFRKKTQIQLQNFLNKKNEILNKQFDVIKQLTKNQQLSDNNGIVSNYQQIVSENHNPANQDKILIPKSELDRIYKLLNLTVSVNIMSFIIFGGLIAWLFYKLNILETKQNHSSNNITQPKRIVNYIEGEFTQIKRHFDNLDERLKTIERGYQNPQSPSLSNYTFTNNQPINTPVNRVVHPLKSQTENIYQSQTSLSNHETKILTVYNSKPRSLSANAITVAESDHTVEQRRIGKKVAPILEKNQLGNYWIVREGNYEYLVPKGNIKINEYNYETISSCFECIGYHPSSSSSFTLLKPATVSSIGQHWQLVEPGKLQF